METSSSWEHDAPEPDAAMPELMKRAAALVRDYPECFWFWRADACISSVEDIRLVIKHLREYGDRRAWLAAQELHQCLSPSFKKKS